MRASPGFVATLKSAARQAYDAGEIERREFSRIMFALSLRPRAVARAQSEVASQAYAAGMIQDAAAADADGFDWSSLLAFIRELLPIILQIISMF